MKNKKQMVVNDFLLWFNNFVEEKDIPYSLFEINHKDEIHFIDNKAIIDLIRRSPSNEQNQIKDIILKIDFNNGDINHFFKYLATAYIKQNF